MQISIAMLMFLLFSDKISRGKLQKDILHEVISN